MAEKHLGAFVIDFDAEQVILGGIAIPLRPKAWQVLLYLAERPGMLVTAAELFDHVWAGVAVTPKTLTNVINELRRALANDPSVRIETRHRRGYQLVTGGPAPAAADALPRAGHIGGMLVGREAELQRLLSLWSEARRGLRQVVLVGGSVGIGKTSLLEAFQAELRRASATGEPGPKPPLLMRGVCMDHQSDPEPYGPVADALESVLSQCDILPLLQRYAPSWLARMPWLLPAEEVAKLRESLAGMGASRALREVVQVLEAISAEQPLLLVLEDIQNADAATLDLVLAMAQREARSQVMVLATYRTRSITNAARSLVNRIALLPPVTRMTLDPLTAAMVRTYLGRRLDDAALGERLAPALELKTGGNPLFLKEVIDAMIHRQWLAREGDRWRLGADFGDVEALIPDSVRALIGQHAQDLEPQARELLEAASMIGEEFIDKLLAASCDRPIESVSTICRRLAESDQFISPVEQRLLPDGLPWTVYRFSHSLYRQGIADQVPPARRRAYHERIAEQLAREYRSCLAEVAPQLALHFGESGQPDRQLEYLDLAVRDAMERFTYVEAAALLQQAIAVAERPPVRMAPEPAPAERRAAAARQGSRYATYGILLMHSNGLGDPLAREAFDRSLACADIHQAFALRFRAQMGRCTSRAYTGREQEALEIAAEMIAAADADHPELVAVACYYGTLAALRLGDYRAAIGFGERSHAALPSASQELPVHYVLEPQSEIVLSYVLTVAGEVNRAEVHRQNALASLRRRSGPYDKAVVFDVQTLSAVLVDDAHSALAAAEQGIAHDSQFGFDGFLATTTAYRAWARCRLGTGAVADYESALSGRAQTTERWYQSVLLAYLAELYLREGDLRRAAATMQRIDPELAYEAEIWRVRGDVLRAEGRRAPARDCYKTAVRIAREQGAGLFEQRAAARLRVLDFAD